MNITLSADEKIIRKAREYARQHQTTVNQMVRDYLTRLVGGQTPANVAAEFRRTAIEQPGHAPQGWRFDRNAIHRHGGEGR